MKNKFAKIFMAVVALPAIFTAYAAAATFASMATTADGKGLDGWATGPSQKEADNRALDGCNSANTSKKGCSSSVAKAVVKAESANRVGISISTISIDDAKRKAIEQCGKPGCKVSEVYDYRKPGFIAVARTAKKDSDAHFYTAWGFTDSDRADETAIEGCQKNAGEPCHMFFRGAIPGPIPVRAAAKTIAPAPMTATNPRSCRPTTATVKCESQCVNGNCVLEYANGCKIRVHVDSNFNPTNNSWEYPLPSC